MLNEDKSPPYSNVSACFDQELGPQVFDYVNGMLAGKEEAWFEEHLLHCDKCYQMTLTLDWVNDTLKTGLEKETISESTSVSETEYPLASYQNITLTSSPASSSPALYLVVGGLGVLGLVALGIIGFNKLTKIKRSLLNGREIAPS